MNGVIFNEEVMKISIKILALVCLVLFWSAPVFAIDKSKKDESKKTVKVDKKKTSQSNDTQRSKKSKSYDDFVDRNNNGIDDRAEKNTPKQTKKKTSKTASPKKTTKP
jgi:hypothetical protein